MQVFRKGGLPTGFVDVQFLVNAGTSLLTQEIDVTELSTGLRFSLNMTSAALADVLSLEADYSSAVNLAITTVGPRLIFRGPFGANGAAPTGIKDNFAIGVARTSDESSTGQVLVIYGSRGQVVGDTLAEVLRINYSNGTICPGISASAVSIGTSPTLTDAVYTFDSTSFRPVANNTRDFGGSSNTWRDGYFGRNLTIGGTLDHDGSTIGFFGVTPATRAAAYTVTNLTTDRSYDADATTLAEVADVLGTLITDLRTYGLVQ